MYTTRSYIMVAFLGCFTIIGLITYNIGIILAVSPLFLALVLILSKPIPTSRNLQFERHVAKLRIQEQEVIEVTLKFHNTGRTIEELEIWDQIPRNTVVVEGSRHTFLHLPSNESIEISYSLKFFKRGSLEIGPIYLRSHDLFHFRFEERIKHIRTEVKVIPRVGDLSNFPLRSQLLIYFNGIIRSNYRGDSHEFRGVRDYNPSTDSLKHINWSATARKGYLQSNEFELMRATKVHIIIDSTPNSSSTLSSSIEMALALSDYLLTNRCQVAISAIDDKISSIPFRSHSRHLIDMVELFTTVFPEPVSNYGILPGRIDVAIEKTHEDAIIIIFSPIQDQRFCSALVKSQLAHRAKVIFAPDAIRKECAFLSTRKIDQEEMKLVKEMMLFQREINHNLLEEHGFPIIYWDADKKTSLEEFARQTLPRIFT
ncbi:MAG: DUF58 domain-containing protein [Candidatus Heimdallarchaeota archaeon]|nr:DUF58 domain-containing protein [Candidatus Heimdallarchaeota archaeon]MCK5047847.1 DUF58 domain-containing protein [Candidatus Heimdallarchaeota archaeon]